MKNDQGLHIFGRPLGLVLIAAYKALWGALEVVAGFIVIFSSQLIAGELMEDPQDIFANWIIRSLNFDPSKADRLGIFICLLGIAKILLAAGLWTRSQAIRKFGLIFFGALGLVAMFEIAFNFTVFKMLALLVDGAIFLYFLRVLPKHIQAGKIE